MKFDLDIARIVRTTYANRSEPEMIQTSARILWAMVVSIAIITSFVGIGVGGWLLSQTMDTINATAETTQKPNTEATLDLTTMQTILDTLNARASRFTALKTSATPAPDPSR